RLDGMWATAIYEPDARRLILLRDPFGIKPLYYTPLAGGFAFASEIKALLALPQVARRVNPARLTDFLCEGWLDHTPETLFDGIHALPGGARLSVTAAGATLHVELHPGSVAALNAGDTCGPVPDYAAELRAAFETALRLQLRSDVPVGSCLS